MFPVFFFFSLTRTSVFIANKTFPKQYYKINLRFNTMFLVDENLFRNTVNNTRLNVENTFRPI